MFTTPSPDDMIEGVIAALQNEILPFVTNPKAQAAVLISQAILQMARQSMAAHDAQIAERAVLQRACDGADVAGRLRMDQHERDGRRARQRNLRGVGRS